MLVLTWLLYFASSSECQILWLLLDSLFCLLVAFLVCGQIKQQRYIKACCWQKMALLVIWKTLLYQRTLIGLSITMSTFPVHWTFPHMKRYRLLPSNSNSSHWCNSSLLPFVCVSKRLYYMPSIAVLLKYCVFELELFWDDQCKLSWCVIIIIHEI